MRVAIATVQVPFVRGGAEMHAEGLRDALCNAGHQVEIVTIPFKWYPAPVLAQQILAWRLMDLTDADRVIGLKFPAYLVRHPNKVLWILHQHRSAYDLWKTPLDDLSHQLGGPEAREIIREADTRLIPEARRVYANSRNVAGRLRRYCGIDSEPLYHPPPFAERFHTGPHGDYLLMPSRVNGLKRQDLIVEAMLLTRHPVRVVFIGGADHPAYLESVQRRAQALPADRLTWLGPVPDARKIALMSESLGILVPPRDEDYGYVTLEAMLSSRAVITCTDSGGPLEFVQHGRNGFVCDPTPAAIAEAMDALWEDRDRARRMGVEGRALYTELGLTWEHVVECLLA